MASIAAPTWACAAMTDVVQTSSRCVATLSAAYVSTALTKRCAAVQVLILKPFSVRCAQTADVVGLAQNIRTVQAQTCHCASTRTATTPANSTTRLDRALSVSRRRKMNCLSDDVVHSP